MNPKTEHSNQPQNRTEKETLQAVTKEEKHFFNYKNTHNSAHTSSLNGSILQKMLNS